MNIKARKDYLEGWRYVDGVNDLEGNKVIRPLNEDEKDWLDKYYAETIVTDFYHSKELRTLKRKIDAMILKIGMGSKRQDVIELKNAIHLATDEEETKALEKKLRILAKRIGKQSQDKRILDLKEKMESLKVEDCLYPEAEDQRALYKENNIRNTCLYNFAKKHGDLLQIDLSEYDKFTTGREYTIDPEYLLIREEIYEEIRILEEEEEGV